MHVEFANVMSRRSVVWYRTFFSLRSAMVAAVVCRCPQCRRSNAGSVLCLV